MVTVEPRSSLRTARRAPFLLLRPTDVALAIQLSLIFLLLYGYELFHFTLSIDEEFFSFRTTAWEAWLSNGRWGMALICAVLPPIWAMPVVATVIFGLGLILAAIELSIVLGCRVEESLLFGVVFIASPVWPHVAEFNTLSYGIGVGLASLGIGARFMFRPGIVAILSAAALTMFAIAVYQSFVFLAAAVVIGAAVRRYLQGGSASLSAAIEMATRGAAILVLAAAAYGAVQALLLRVFQIEIQYVDGFLRLSDYQAALGPTLAHAVDTWGALIAGTDPTFLGWGPAVLALPVLGFAVSCWQGLGAGSTWRGRATFCGLLACLAIVAVVPSIVSAGNLPTRAAIWLPLVFALFSGATFRASALRPVAAALLGVHVLACAYISNALFYSDAVAREQDMVTATRLLERIESMRRQDDDVKFTVVGARQSQEPVRQVEVFGASFFGWDQGNVFRVNDLFRLLGTRTLQPLRLSDLPSTAERAASMPSWPSTGSVDWIDDILVVKLSPMTPYQKDSLCQIHPESTLCATAHSSK